ncbi:cation:proton antiporter subunit C [Thiohalobacter thiocyanaticus]|uniref:Na+/H+ antiporter subunit C n=1 Tax=Thiohalobacter thiocyanaticus TaxID=585455 RepID=A0A426QJ31_9GAMM|nr:cation:proton antiporter subunit C [Thiohalobacter thiocyanaticus]RRQ21755.1 Na+/H+ antiporter subunit C [Thiohalobacter thiocyanaticus]
MTAAFYALAGVALVVLGLYGLSVQAHLLRKLLAVNILGSGVFLVLVSLGGQPGAAPDPVPHAMVITGIVVAVSATALGLVLMLKVAAASGRPTLDDAPKEDRCPKE